MGEEHKVLSGGDYSFQKAGMVHLLDPDCTGSCISSCGVVFKFVFCVGFFKILSWYQNFWKLGELGGKTPFSFFCVANCLTLRSNKSF